MSVVSRNGTTAFIGLPEREATKLQDLWQRDEVGVELSVEVKAPVVVGVYPMRIARFVIDQTVGGNGYANGNGYHHEPVPDPTSPASRGAPVYRDSAQPAGRPPDDVSPSPE